MHILIASCTYGPARNGQAVFTTNLAEGLARRGHRVLMVGQAENGSPHQAEQNGVQIFRAPAISLERWHSNAAISPFPGRSVQQVVAAFNPDIIHLQDHYPVCQAAYRAARQLGIKVAGTNHFMPENLAAYIPGAQRFKPVYDRAMWDWVLGLYNRLDMVTAPSRTAVQILRRWGLKAPAAAISCGLDLERFRPDPSVDRKAMRARYGIDPDRTVFLFVGRVDGEKRLDVLLQAMALLPDPSVQLAIAGRGSALDGLMAQAEALGLGERVRFTGFVPDADLPALLNSVDVFAMPSQAELLSIASLEAMACGRPVLAARAGALPELVTEGANGALFEPGNLQDAARSMARLAAQRAQRAEFAHLGAASLARAQLHGLDNILSQYEDLYAGLLNEKQPAPAWKPAYDFSYFR